MTLLLLISCLLALALYLFVTGFHDASNAVAIPVRTRALTPRTAVGISAFFNFLGLLMCTAFLSKVLVADWLNIPAQNFGLGMLLTALLAQIIWGFTTWRLRMPSSSTHALIGGLLGSIWAAQQVGFEVTTSFSEPLLMFFIIPLLGVPILTFIFSWLAVIPAYHMASKATPREVNRASRITLSFTNSLISLGHGIQVGQRAFIIFGLICLAASIQKTPQVMVLAFAGFALMLICGTLLGGWRIGHTIVHRLAHIDPLRGAVAQTVTALALIFAPLSLGSTVSSSHLAATSVLGAGLNQRFAAVRLNTALKLVLTWLATLPASFLLSATLFLALSPVL